MCSHEKHLNVSVVFVFVSFTFMSTPRFHNLFVSKMLADDAKSSISSDRLLLTNKQGCLGAGNEAREYTMFI